MKKNTFTATGIGFCFTILCLISTSSFVVPLIAVFPVSAGLEDVFIDIFGSGSYKKIGMAALITLCLLLSLIMFFYYRSFYKKLQLEHSFSPMKFIAFLALAFFIVHPLGFYIYVSSNWNMAKDGQFIFACVVSFPYTSTFFIVIGFITDLVKNKKLRSITLDSV